MRRIKGSFVRIAPAARGGFEKDRGGIRNRIHLRKQPYRGEHADPARNGACSERGRNDRGQVDARTPRSDQPRRSHRLHQRFCAQQYGDKRSNDKGDTRPYTARDRQGERRTLSYHACHDFGQHPHTAATVPYRPANGGFHVEVCRNGGTGRAPRFGSCISSRRVGTNPSVYRRKRAHIPSVDESIPIAQRLHARQPQRLGRSENRLLQGIGTITRRAIPRCLSKACNRGGNSVPATVSANPLITLATAEISSSGIIISVFW